jgi:hypothetical protein
MTKRMTQDNESNMGFSGVVGEASEGDTFVYIDNELGTGEITISNITNRTIQEGDIYPIRFNAVINPPTVFTDDGGTVFYKLGTQSLSFIRAPASAFRALRR